MVTLPFKEARHKSLYHYYFKTSIRLANACVGSDNRELTVAIAWALVIKQLPDGFSCPGLRFSYIITTVKQAKVIG